LGKYCHDIEEMTEASWHIGRYHIDIKFTSCTCPFTIYTGKTCKHIHMIELLIEGKEGNEQDMEMYQSAIDPTLFINGKESEPDEMDGKIHAHLGQLEQSPGRPPQTSPCPISHHMCKNAITHSNVLTVLANEARSKDLPGKTRTAKTATGKTATGKTAMGKTTTTKTTTTKTRTTKTATAKTRTTKTATTKTGTMPDTDDNELKSHPTTSTTKKFIPAMEGSKRVHRPNHKYLNE
jgi:hypothetical protein